MGLIKQALNSVLETGKGAVKGTLEDQYKEAIRCPNMSNDLLMKAVTSPTGVISNGSIVVVDPGQCAVIVDNGRVIDATAEEGTFVFDNSSTPSFFAGQFKESFKEMWKRFTFHGQSSQKQTVYFFNLKEIMDNKFGTSSPVSYQDWSHPYKNEMTNSMMPLALKIRCYGTYTFQISDPAAFMSQLAGTATEYRKDDVVSQIGKEVEGVLQNLMNELGNSAHKVPVLELPSQTDEIRTMMDQQEFDKPIRERGLRIRTFVIQSVTPTEESDKAIKDYEFAASSAMQRGRMAESYANAMEKAADNANGAPAGFIGLGIANMASGGAGTGAVNNMFAQAGATQAAQETYDPYATAAGAVAGAATQQPAQPESPATPTAEEVTAEPTDVTAQATPTTKKCPKCNYDNGPDSKFCANCGNQL